MACGTATCQSGCYNDEEDKHSVAEKREATNGFMPSADSICLKCKANRSIGSSSAGSDSLGDCEKFCADCFRSNLFGKFKFAVTSNAMISPTDSVLVAFSGGSSSRVALEFVHEMQYKAQKNFDASRDRSLPVFGVGVAFIDESDVYPVPCEEFDKAVDEMRTIVSSLTPPRKEFHVAPIQTIFSSDSIDGKNRLKELLSDVNDVTGREDLLLHLRMLSLQKVAIYNGYTKIVLGSCTSKIACHVIAATIKGQGYSLAADIQYVDARWDIPVVLPLRDCLSQELNLLCSLDSLKTVEVFNGPRAGINGLVSSFVKLLQEENSSRECTIVRTAGKLTPFQFNKMPESDDSNVRLASQRRQKRFNMKPNESLPPDSFCPICSSPLNKSDFPSLKNGQTSSQNLADLCCASCRFQILPKEQLSLEHFHSLLPHPIIDRSKNNGCPNRLREQIQDFLLSDNEDGT